MNDSRKKYAVGCTLRRNIGNIQECKKDFMVFSSQTQTLISQSETTLKSLILVLLVVFF